MRRYLLTVESINDDDLTKLVNRLQLLPQRVLLRIPIQEQDGEMDKPESYEDIFKELSRHADLMIEFVDSDATTYLTEAQYEAHVTDCLRVLRRYCTVGEAGNEINGANWNEGGAGPHRHSPTEIARMVRSAETACQRAGLETAITYYLSTDEEPPMLDWMRSYASDLQSDYGLISYYPNSARVAFTADETFEKFKEFAGTVKAPVIGWGEYGLNGDYGNVANAESLVRMVEGEYWPRFSRIRNYAGFGGFWAWGDDESIDHVLGEVWR